MHGRKRQINRDQQSQQRQQEENRQRVAKYCQLNDHVMDQRASQIHTDHSLAATQQLLELNPELHTIWNYRRQILLRLPQWTSHRQQLLEQELEFLMAIIPKNIKSYWMWNHRIWALSQLPHPKWEKELGLVAKLLEVDARNFHGWNYRRFVVSRLKQSMATEEQRLQVDKSEFEFTTQQINRDCANHAAWHNRSKLLPAILQDTAGEERLEPEIKLVLNAIYTDPNDHNAWLYHEWLVDIQPTREAKYRVLRAKVHAIRELLELEEDGPGAKWPLIELVEALVAIDKLDPSAVSQQEKQECRQILTKLCHIDPCHRGRYLDMTQTIN